MAASQLDIILGRLLVQQHIIDQSQLEGLLTVTQTVPGTTLEEVLLDSAVISAEQLARFKQHAQQMLSRPPAAAPPQASSPRLQPIPAQHAPQASSPRLQPVGAQPAPQVSSPRLQPIAAPPAPQTSSPRLQPIAAQPAPPVSSPRLQPIPAATPPAPPARPAARGGVMVLPTIELPAEPEPPAVMDLELVPIEEAAPEPEPRRSMPVEFTAGSPREEMELILRTAADMEVSDLHLHSGCRIFVRQHGELAEQETQVFEAEHIEALVMTLLTETQQARFQERGELDFACTVKGVGRFRANVYKQLRGVDASFRVIPSQIPGLEGLGLPSSLVKLTEYSNGLVLCTGPSGCGKSTTLASLVSIINQTREDHILTIEDPIEFVHQPMKCSVNQRQVGTHTESFPRALRGALREDPDVIVVGELRDLETISLALSAAETGHLVLGTLHTNNAMRTVNRLINVFPPDQQEQVRAMLSESLRGVISQRLVRTMGGQKRVPALEIMMVNKAVSNLIKDNKTLQIRSILQTGGSEGMCLLDNSLAALVKSNTITREEAMRHAEEPKRFMA